MKTRIKPYSLMELEFVDSLGTNYSLKEIVEMFNKKFNRNINVKQLTTMRHKHGLNRKQKHRYSQEEKDFIKGMLETYNRNQIVMREYEKKFGRKISFDTVDLFRKQFNIHIRKRKTCGQEGIKGGKVAIKLPNNKWQYKHRIIYEQHYGKIPKDYFVTFLDGNNRNFDINNLKLVKDKVFRRIARYTPNNDEIMKTYIMASELVVKANEKEKEMLI